MSTKTPASTLDKFLEVLSTAANVRASAAAAGISPRTAYRHQKSDPDFAERWEAAILDALSRIEERIFNAALDGDMQAARWLLARRMPHAVRDVEAWPAPRSHPPNVPRLRPPPRQPPLPYKRDPLERVWRAYFPREGGSQSATPRQVNEINDLRESLSATNPTAVADTNGRKSLETKACRGVADTTPSFYEEWQERAAIMEDLKKLEFNHKPKGAFGIDISMKFKPGRQPPIHYYREKQLETEVVCTNCTLRYSVYGVFAFCPDCGQHNSIQILDENLEVVRKMLEMAMREGKALAEKFIENALEDCVSAFDGFGRELSWVHANKARTPAKAEKMSFQNLEAARKSFLDLFGIDLSTAVEPEEWRAAAMAFQKRHLIAHKLGVVDQDYMAKTGDTRAGVGRKISIDAGEVNELAEIINTLALRMAAEFQKSDENS